MSNKIPATLVEAKLKELAALDIEATRKTMMEENPSMASAIAELDDEVILIMLHKLRVNLDAVPTSQQNESRAWLDAHHYSHHLAVIGEK